MILLLLPKSGDMVITQTTVHIHSLPKEGAVSFCQKEN